MQVVFFILFLVSNGAMASDSVQVRTGSQSTVLVELVRKGEAALIFHYSNGISKKEEKLGQEFVPFQFDHKEEYLVHLGLNGEQAETIFVRVLIPPHSGGILAFQFNKNKEYALVPHGEMDYLPVSDTGLVTMDKAGKIKATFMKHDGSKNTVTKSYQWVKDHFEKSK